MDSSRPDFVVRERVDSVCEALLPTYMVAGAWGALAALASPSDRAFALMVCGCLAFSTVVGVLSARRQGRRRRALEELVDELRQRGEDFTAVAQVARDVAAGGDARATICATARRMTSAASACLLEPDGHGALAITAASGLDAVGQRVHLRAEPSGSAVAFRSRRRFFVPEVAGHPALSHRFDHLVAFRSVVFEPVLRGAEAVGVLVVGWTRPLDGLSPHELEAIGLLADEAAIAIERADRIGRLDPAAHTDALTGVPNRRAWDEQLGRELARGSRTGAPVSVALLDLDGFKDLNDRHGHQAGDRRLREVVAAWRGELRAGDVLARLGGDEFAVLVLEGSEDEVVELVDRLRRGTPSRQRFSAGVATWDGDEDLDALMARADEALYAAKRAGRGRTSTS
jgi:diguanylate cyclase (GGDEF)-like protein